MIINVNLKNDKRVFKGSPLLIILNNIWNDKEIIEGGKSADSMSVPIPARREWFNPDNNRLFSCLAQLG